MRELRAQAVAARSLAGCRLAARFAILHREPIGSTNRLAAAHAFRLAATRVRVELCCRCRHDRRRRLCCKRARQRAAAAAVAVVAAVVWQRN